MVQNAKRLKQKLKHMLEWLEVTVIIIISLCGKGLG